MSCMYHMVSVKTCHWCYIKLFNPVLSATAVTRHIDECRGYQYQEMGGTLDYGWDIGLWVRHWIMGEALD